MTGVHERIDIAEFLDEEYRQVWAADRATGEPRYIDVGQADELRDIARHQWRCPVPDCDAPEITTRGQSRRDHFKHLAGGGHTDRESVWHIDAKAMISDWAASSRQPVTVAEEQTVKDDASRVHRRADVMVTWPAGSQVAFEVEYKPMTYGQWTHKQHDYESQGVVCAWLFGHLPRYLSLLPRPLHLLADEVWDRVRIRPLARDVAAHGLPVLHVNPTTRHVGTVVVEGDPETGEWWDPVRLSDIGTRLPRNGDTQGRLVVCSIDECHLDPVHGIVTPAMMQIRAEQADRERRAQQIRAEQDRERQAALRHHLAPAETRPGSIRGYTPGQAHCIHCEFRAAMAAQGREIPETLYGR